MRSSFVWHTGIAALVIFLSSSSQAFTQSSRLPRCNTRQKHWYPKFRSLQTDRHETKEILTEKIDTCRDILQRIDAMESSLRSTNSTIDLELQEKALKDMEKDFGRVLSRLVPPEGMTMDEYTKSIKFFFVLPPDVRLAFVRALGEEDELARDVVRVPQLVSKISNERESLTPQVLRDSLKRVRQERKERNGQEDGIVFEIIDSDTSDDEVALEVAMERFTSRMTRKEGFEASPADLQTLMKALNSSIFIPNGEPEKFPGGYVVRGKNRKETGQELIAAIDAKLPQEWNGTVSYIQDITTGRSARDEENILLLLHKDFSPVTSKWFYRATTAVSIVTAILFAVGVYGSNDVVAKEVIDLSTFGDLSGIQWLNEKIAEVLLPLAIILASHEIGHAVVANSQKIQTASTFPTLLPFYGSLPLTGSLTRITSSPKNRTALFDFAFLGPLLGYISSFIFLGVGLVATDSILNEGPEAARYLPALPVSVLRLSTLGGTIIDDFFGGNGYILAQDPTTAIPLHPFAIAGFCGVLINAIELLPLGATDGGRLSLSVFGRLSHGVVGPLTWAGLLVSFLLLPENSGDVLVTAWVLNNFVQNDMEVPCRDETVAVNLPRTLAAMALWFLAALTYIPIT